MATKLIKNADWVLTMDAAGTRLKDADILIRDNVIAEVGPQLRPAEPPDEVIDARGRVVLPGFVNTHHHTFQSLVRNIHVANGLKLEPWLAVVYQIFEDITPGVAKAGTLVGLGDLLKTGCTTSQDHFYAHPRGQKGLIDAQIETAAQLGIRFHPTRGSLSIGKIGGSPHVPDSLVETTDEIITDCERLIDRYHDTARYAMCRVGLAPCWPEFETREILVATRELAEKRDVQCHSHLAESRGEFEFCMEKYGCTPVQFVQQLGWLGPRYYFAHCVQFEDTDVETMAATQTGIAHCPNSNMFLNSGVCRVPHLLEKGACLSIGVDGAASNNASDMLGEIRNTYLVHRLKWGDAAPSADAVLRMATVGGAKVLGRDDIGMVQPGMAADLTLFNWDQLQYTGGKNDPACSIVLSGDARMVDTVLVNGQVVIQGGKLTRIDEEKARHEVERLGKALLQSASARVPELAMDI